MKILLSPSKKMNLDNLTNHPLTINSTYYHEKLKYLANYDMTVGSESKQAIKLYSGVAFKELNSLDDEFYNDVVILSSLYGYSYGHDYISSYRLDYTTKEGRYLRDELYEEINQMLQAEDVVFDLASKEFSKGIVHPNMITFEFYVMKDGVMKQVSATSKKLRGAMVEYLRVNGPKGLEDFNAHDFEFCSKLSDECKFVYVKQ